MRQSKRKQKNKASTFARPARYCKQTITQTTYNIQLISSTVVVLSQTHNHKNTHPTKKIKIKMPSKKKKKPAKSGSRANDIPTDITTSTPNMGGTMHVRDSIKNHTTISAMKNTSNTLVQHADFLQDKFTTEKDPARKLQILKNGLLQAGTKIDVLSVDANYSYTHNDVLYGDGDQSKITLDLPRIRHYEWFRNLDATQCAHYEPFSFQTSTRNGNNPNPFLAACLAGKPTEVENLIKKTKFGSKERNHLLDGREAFFRRSALLMVAKSRNVMKDRVGTIRILLKYGARPDARDVCGNHVLHYLANAYAVSSMFNLFGSQQSDFALISMQFLTDVIPLFLSSISVSASSRMKTSPARKPSKLQTIASMQHGVRNTLERR